MRACNQCSPVESRSPVHQSDFGWLEGPVRENSTALREVIHTICVEGKRTTLVLVSLGDQFSQTLWQSVWYRIAEIRWDERAIGKGVCRKDCRQRQ
jgi:hypothetical protein